MAKKLLILICFALLTGVGCKKKDRLASDTYSMSITPPATTAVINVAKTFTVVGQAPGGNVDTDPEWSIEPSSGATVMSPTLPLFGSAITVTFTDVGFYTLTATYGDKTASTQVRIFATTPASTADGALIYSEQGIPENSDIFLGSLTLDEQFAGGPEGANFMRATNVTNAFWMVSLAGTADLDAYAGGKLKFYIRLDRPMNLGETLRLEMQRPANGPKWAVSMADWDGFSTSNTGWQAVSVDLSKFFSGQGLVQSPFIFVSSVGAPPMTIDFDYIRWEK